MQEENKNASEDIGKKLNTFLDHFQQAEEGTVCVEIGVILVIKDDLDFWRAE